MIILLKRVRTRPPPLVLVVSKILHNDFKHVHVSWLKQSKLLYQMTFTFGFELLFIVSQVVRSINRIVYEY